MDCKMREQRLTRRSSAAAGGNERGKHREVFHEIKRRLHSGQRLDAMKGCNAWAKRAHAVGMKNKINSTLHDRTKLIKPGAGGNGAMGRQVFKLGLDVDLRSIAVAIQCERGRIGPARKFTREQLIAWVKQKIAQGHRVHAVSECCGLVIPCTSNWLPAERTRSSRRRCV
jgi:hypothetical protein